LIKINLKLTIFSLDYFESYCLKALIIYNKLKLNKLSKKKTRLLFCNKI